MAPAGAPMTTLEAPPPDQPTELMPLARKLVGLAREQRNALQHGAREKYRWIWLRRNEVTERLSRLLAARVPVEPEQAAELLALRDDMLAVDKDIEQLLRGALAEVDTKRRVFARSRKAIGSYLSSGPRRRLFDQIR